MQPNTIHQQNQIQVINSLEQQVQRNAIGFSTVSPVDDYQNDSRICLTSVHFPHKDLVDQIQMNLIHPLQKHLLNAFFYPSESLHMTIKNVRVIDDPPRFSKEDVVKVTNVFETVVPNHVKFKVYFYRLMLFPNNLALIGTTDPELDTIIFDLDKKLMLEGVPDDKKYINSQYFFCNMTLARFGSPPPEAFVKNVETLSQSISIEPYTVDSVSLVTCTAVFTKKNVIGTWNLR